MIDQTRGEIEVQIQIRLDRQVDRERLWIDFWVR